MPGPPPKHASTRTRRNKTAGAKTLSLVHDVKTPELPKHPEVVWHDLTKAWWADIWSSPMAPEFDKSDLHGLYLLAILVNSFWLEPSQAVAAEIRLQRQCFGLSPIDRRRLQWEIDRGEAAEKSTKERRAEARPKAVSSSTSTGKLATKPKGKDDPRHLLAN